MNEALIAEAEIGDEALRFKESDLGKVLLGMAEQEVLAAQQELEVVDPTQTEKIRELQWRAKMYRGFEGWLNELISRGTDALESWRQEHGTKG